MARAIHGRHRSSRGVISTSARNLDHTSKLKSYTSQKTNLSALIREAFFLYCESSRVRNHIDATFRNLRLLESRVLERYGLRLQDLDILDIGVGQFPIQMFYFARYNRVVGIDWNVIAQGLNPIPYITMFLLNGPRRTAKTIARKLLGIDRQYRKAAMEQLNLSRLPELTVHQMDASKMAFPDETFNFVHSSAVFHHLSNPRKGISEAVRILKRGGVAHIAFHLFTSETGALDPREFRDEQGNILRWPHLRSPYADRVIPNAYLNRIRLDAWRKLFEAKMPGAEFILNRSSRSGAAQDAQTLINQGDLAGYSLEELLVHDVTILWRKPSFGSLC